ncbi:MAG: hypothetical protein R2688_06885 [Fimbriimonadaceae bacterium]
MKALLLGAVAALGFAAIAQVKDGGFRDIDDMITVSGTQAWMVMPPKLILAGDIEYVDLSNSNRFALVRFHRRTEKDMVRIAESNVDPPTSSIAVVEIATGRINEIVTHPDTQADHIYADFIDNSEYVIIREFRPRPKTKEEAVLLNTFIMPALGKPTKVAPVEDIYNLIFVPTVGQFAKLKRDGEGKDATTSIQILNSNLAEVAKFSLTNSGKQWRIMTHPSRPIVYSIGANSKWEVDLQTEAVTQVNNIVIDDLLLPFQSHFSTFGGGKQTALRVFHDSLLGDDILGGNALNRWRDAAKVGAIVTREAKEHGTAGSEYIWFSKDDGFYLSHIVPVDYDLVSKAGMDREKDKLLGQAKMMGVGMAIYCTDYDDHFPLSGNWQEAVHPYLKNADYYEGFEYYLNGDNALMIDEITKTAIGIIRGKYGAAVVYADTSTSGYQRKTSAQRRDQAQARAKKLEPFASNRSQLLEFGEQLTERCRIESLRAITEGFPGIRCISIILHRRRQTLPPSPWLARSAQPQRRDSDQQ